jgi:hypothetical protein
MPRSIINKSTPILFAERIEPALAFWEKLGWRRTTEVPAGDHLAFAILTSGSLEIMYETVESVAKEAREVREAAASSKAFLYLEVPSLAAVKKALAGTPLFQEERKMFYGTIEIAYRDPGGHFVTFAEFDRKPEEKV